MKQLHPQTEFCFNERAYIYWDNKVCASSRLRIAALLTCPLENQRTSYKRTPKEIEHFFVGSNLSTAPGVIEKGVYYQPG